MSEPITTTVPADGSARVPVARPVVRDVVRRAVTHNVRAHVEEARRLGSAAPADATTEHSTELVRLLEHLQSTLAHYVRGRRADGVSVDRVLSEAKLLVQEAESCEGWFDPSNTLAALVVRWSVVAYNDGAREA